MNRLCLLGATVAVAACSEVPEVQGDVEGGNGSGGYSGPCRVVDDFIERGTLSNYVLQANVGTPVVNFGLYISPIQGQVTNNASIDVYVAADPLLSIEGEIADLGTGANGNFATCSHCMLIYLDCNEDGLECFDGPYFPRSGRAVATRLALNPGEPFIFEMEGVELEPVDLDETTLLSVYAGQDDADCLYMDRFLISWNTELIDNCTTFDFFECPIEATAFLRGIF